MNCDPIESFISCVAFVLLPHIEPSILPHIFCIIFLLTLWRPAAFGDFRKKRLNTHGIAGEFIQSSMLYRPGKSLKRRSKSSSLHLKKIFCLGDAGFL